VQQTTVSQAALSATRGSSPGEVVDVNWVGDLELDFSEWGTKDLTRAVRIALGNPRLWRESQNELTQILTRKSVICRILKANPASNEMLEIVYPYEVGLKLTVDDCLALGLSGQALRDRLAFCSKWMADYWLSRVNGQKMTVVDLGGGSGRYGIEAIKLACLSPDVFKKRFRWICLDRDPEALRVGHILTNEAGVRSAFKFVPGNFFEPPTDSNDQGDLGVLIGVLCGMTPDEAIMCLKRIKTHMKPGAELLAATLKTQAFIEDPYTFRVLSNVLGWYLKPKTVDQVVEVFEKAGWEVNQVLSERNDGRPGQYAIVQALNI
jgi:hypothetical protein